MDESELPDQIARLEQRIEELSASVEKSRKAILLSKVSIAAGGLLTLAIVFGLVRADPLPIVVSIASVFGGIVGFGTNVSTARQDASAMNEAEALRAELIGRLELREIAEQPSVSLITRH